MLHVPAHLQNIKEEEVLKQQLESIEVERTHLANLLEDERISMKHLDEEEERCVQNANIPVL